MVFYANSSSYDALVAAARDVAGEIRKVVATLPGKALSEQSKPMRTEKHYRKYKGDGPARMMAKFRTFKKSQLVIEKAAADEFDATLEKVTAALAASTVSDASDTTGWETITKIPLRDDAVYIGLTNPYIEDKMIRITRPALRPDVAHAAVFLGFGLQGFHGECRCAERDRQVDQGSHYRRGVAG
jgi:hypothetical protein